VFFSIYLSRDWCHGAGTAGTVRCGNQSRDIEEIAIKKILVIDDSELVLTMAKDALEEYGYTVQTVTNGIEANTYIFSKNRPDLIIMDVMMPMLDGNNKAKILKGNEMSRDIPILLLSSKSEEEMHRLTTEAGADGYILKPFSPMELAGKVRKCLLSEELK